MAGFWGVRFQLPSWVQGELRRRVTALAAGVVLAAASLVVTTPAQAQSFTWNGASTDYNAGGNWTPSAGPPPVVAGQSAVFDTTGSIPVVVTGAIAPDSWIFTAAFRPTQDISEAAPLTPFELHACQRIVARQGGRCWTGRSGSGNWELKFTLPRS